jgi:hypothetical protein
MGVDQSPKPVSSLFVMVDRGSERLRDNRARLRERAFLAPVWHRVVSPLMLHMHDGAARVLMWQQSLSALANVQRRVLHQARGRSTRDG